MIERLLPRILDNTYRGPRAALWLLGIVAIVKMLMGINSVLNGVYVLKSADGVPLSAYPPDAAQTIVALFALWAWGLFLFAVLAVLALVRYRSATSFMFTLLLAEHLGRKLILQFVPIVRSVSVPASWINTALLVLMLGGLLLSLWRPDAPVDVRQTGA